MLEQVEQKVVSRPVFSADWADALQICADRGLTDRRVRAFLDKCLEKMVTACLEHTTSSEKLAKTLIYASTQIGTALGSDFSPWAAKSLVALMPERNSSLSVVFRSPEDAQVANDLLVRCSGAVAAKTKEMLHNLGLRDLIFQWCRGGDRIHQLEAVLRACNCHETKDVGKPGSTLTSLAQRLLQQLDAIPFEDFPAALTEDGAGKQMSTDGLEGLDRMLQLAGDEFAEKAHLVLKQVAVKCNQSSKLLLRRAGLDIFAKLAVQAW